MSTSVHERHPEWKDHQRETNPRKFFVPTFILSGVTVVESHGEDNHFGYSNVYIYTRDDGWTMRVVNSYGSIGWRDGLWEVQISDHGVPEKVIEAGKLTDMAVEKYLYKFIRGELSC